MIRRSLVTLALAAALCAPAAADTLYQSGPPPVGPGHPMHLGADHKASQVGDLLLVVFNFAVNTNSSDVSSSNNSYKMGADPGAGLANVSLLRFGATLNTGRQSQSARTQNGTNSFVSSMEALVTDVLPSGALRVAGDQLLSVNGQKQTLHVTGLVRPEDIDSTDSVLSNRMANVQATFSGNFQEKNKGLLRRIVDWLF